MAPRTPPPPGEAHDETWYTAGSARIRRLVSPRLRKVGEPHLVDETRRGWIHVHHRLSDDTWVVSVATEDDPLGFDLVACRKPGAD